MTARKVVKSLNILLKFENCLNSTYKKLIKIVLKKVNFVKFVVKLSNY